MADLRVLGNLILISPVGSGTVALGSQANGPGGFILLLPTSIPQIGQTLLVSSVFNGNTATLQWGAGAGVASVGIVAPPIFSVAGSPVTASGNITLSLASQAANTVLAGPISGSAAVPSFRLLTASDLGSAVFGASGVGHSAGAVPDPGSVAGTTRFLREDSTWAVPADSDIFVTSVFGRTGAVTAQSGDYSFAQISGTPQLPQTFAPVLGGSPPAPTEFLTGYNASTGLFSAATPSGSGGGVTSFSGDGTIITNSGSTGAVHATIAGTSGGIPYFSSASAWASSAVLAAGHVLLGGGAGSAPTSDASLDDGVTVASTLTYTGVGGITAPIYNATTPPSAYQITIIDPDVDPNPAPYTVLGIPDAGVGGDVTSVGVGIGAFREGNLTKSQGRNTAMGYEAMALADHCDDNCAFGYQALSNLTTLGNNCAFGYHSLLNATGVITLPAAVSNSAYGSQSLISLTTGYDNCAFGYNAGSGSSGEALITGNSCVIVGAVSNVLLSTDVNSIVIGATTIGAGSNTAVIGNNAMTDVYLGGALLGVGAATIHARKIILAGSSSGSATIGVASAAGTPNQINLPISTGTAGQVLSTDGGNPQQLSWTTVSAGSSAFSTITSDTNTTATMTVGPGAVLTFSGSGSPPSEGEINANFIYGVQVSATHPTTGQVLTATSATSANWQTPKFTGTFNSVNVTPITVSANTSAAQNLMSATIPAGTLNSVGKTIRVHIAGVYSTPAASTTTVTVAITLGALTLISMTTAALGAIQVTNNKFLLDGYVTTQTAGASAAFEASGDLIIDLGAASTAADSVYGDTNTATIGTLDTTIVQTLQVTIAFSSASASNSATQRQMITESIN
jgi:hypothetical protein